MTGNNNIYKKALKVIRNTLNISRISIFILFFFSAKSELISKENVIKTSKQNYLEMYGVIKLNEMFVIDGKKYIDSVEVEILNSEGKVLGSIQSNEIGKCFFRLPLNEQFVLNISKKGLVSKLINIDTRTSNEEIKKYNLPFEIEMYKEIKDLEILLLKEAIASVKYNYYLNDFDYNYKYTMETNEKIKQIYSDYYSKENTKKRQSINNDTTKNSIAIEGVGNSSEIKIFNTDKKALTVTDNNILNKTKSDTLNGLKVEALENNKKNSVGKIEYKIQIIALAGYLPIRAKFFEKCGKADEYFHRGKYKYTLGEFSSYKSALSVLSYIKSIGYNDAFLVSFLNGERIEILEALVLQNSK